MRTGSFKNLIENSQSDLISKRTIIGLVRSILTPLAENNSKSMVFTRLRNRDEISGLIKRLEYSTNVEMHDFLDNEVVKRDDFVEIEFILLTSPRFNAFLLWDYSATSNKDKSKVYFLMNSKAVNDCFENLNVRSKIDFSEEFHSYKPERRENELLNEALSHIVGILNENICENEFKNKEEIKMAQKLESLSEIRACCHEIKNQLSIVDIYSKLLEKEFGQNKNIEMIKKAASLIVIQLNEIKGFSENEGRSEDIVFIINKAIEMLDESAKAENNKIIFKNKAEGLQLALNYNKFLMVLTNILKNANESTKNDEISMTLEKDNNSAKILIRNHGEKIADEIKGKIFEEGFSTKENGWGIGLGVCKRYLASQNCEIKLINSDEKYTEFEIKIPLNLSIDELGIYL